MGIWTSLVMSTQSPPHFKQQAQVRSDTTHPPCPTARSTGQTALETSFHQLAGQVVNRSDLRKSGSPQKWENYFPLVLLGGLSLCR